MPPAAPLISGSADSILEMSLVGVVVRPLRYAACSLFDYEKTSKKEVKA
jgi:hypothetical protein